MNNREVINRLLRDMEKIELPPIPEKVLQAVREQKQKYLEYKELRERINRQKRNAAKKWVFAAMLTALAVSVPIIVVVSNNTATNNIIADNSSVSDQSLSTNSKESTSAEAGTLEHIKIINLYGTVSLSSRSEVELETMLESYSKENSVYEDDKYLYNFNSDDKLIEILKTDLDEDIQGKPVTKQEITDKAEAVLKEYFPDFADEISQMDIRYDPDRVQTWYISITKKNNDLSQKYIHMTFNRSGILQRADLNGSSTNIGKIKKSEAIQIALNELRSGKYDILDFLDNDLQILVNEKVNADKKYYVVLIDKVPTKDHLNNKFYSTYVFTIDSKTGIIYQTFE